MGHLTAGSQAILHGDCLKLMSDYQDGSFDIIITSPPYNLRNTVGFSMKYPRTNTKLQKLSANGYGDGQHTDDMPHDEYVEWQRACLREMLRLIPDTGAIFYNHKWRVQGGLMQDRADIVDGFPVRQIIIWKRAGGVNFNLGYFLPKYEVIYLIAKPKFKLQKEAVGLGDVWEITQARGNSHPAPFPIELPRRIIAATRPKRVLDPFCGSGTTLLAANELGLSFVGMDIVEEYCIQAERRLLQQNGDGVFRPYRPIPISRPGGGGLR